MSGTPPPSPPPAASESPLPAGEEADVDILVASVLERLGGGPEADSDGGDSFAGPAVVDRSVTPLSEVTDEPSEDGAAPMMRVDLGHAWRALPGRAPTNDNTRRLLERMQANHQTRAKMHWEASQMFLCAHRAFTISIMVVSFVTAIAVNAVNADGTLPEGWTNFLSGAVLSLVGVLTAINEFLGYQALEEKHRTAKTGHRNAANFIATAIARDRDGGPEADFDYGTVFDKVSELQTELQTIDVEIPARILARHDRAETDAMWMNQHGRVDGGQR